MKKLMKKISSWFKKDANGKTNRPAIILLCGILGTPLVILEGAKIGLYQEYVVNESGLIAIANALPMSFISVLGLKGKGNFGQNSVFHYEYIIIFLMVYATVLVMSFIAADRQQRLSHYKDGNNEFQDPDKFNTALAYPVGKEEVSEPKENSYETGNMITSEHTRYYLSGTSSTYSCSLVVGSIGSGKSFTYVKPNILQMNSSYVVTDPKGELTASLGTTLMEHGYDVRVFNLDDQEYSCKYNPFAYIKDQTDVVITVDAFLNATNGDTGNGGDPFFPIAEKNFYYALFYYVYTMMEPEERTLKAVYELYASADEQEPAGGKRNAEVQESEFDKKFREVAEKDPTNPCLSFYKTFKNGSPKTKQSILISAGIKLWFLSVPKTADLLSDDELHLERIGDRKTALFVIIPSDKDTFKCLSAMMFTQLFQTLYYVGLQQNPKSWLLQKGNCVAARSKMFVRGSKAEKEEYDALVAKKALFQKALIQDDNEDMKTDAKLKAKFETFDDYGDCPWPMSRIVVPVSEMGDSVDMPKTDDGKYYIIEEFKSRAAAEYVLDAGQNGEIVKGKDSLTCHTRFMLDEFYNIGKIEGFDNKIATFRSLRISADIIVQSITQLNMMYDDKPEVIVGCCDIKVCLGINTKADAEFFSEQMGQTTVTAMSTSLSAQGLMGGSTGQNISENAEMLMRVEQILQMNGDECKR